MDVPRPKAGPTNTRDLISSDQHGPEVTDVQCLVAELGRFFGQSSDHEPPASGSAQEQSKVIPETFPTIEDRYRVLVEQIPAVVFMAFVDGGISEAYVSPQVEQVLGFSREEWLDDPIRWYYQIHPDDRQRWSIEAAQMLLTGNPLKSIYRVMARDGRVVWFHCEAKLVRRKDGQPWFVHGVGFDITDLKETEQALREETEERERLQRIELEHQIAKGEQTESKLAAIVESSEDAIISKDLEGVIQSWNKGAEQIFGWRAEEAVGQHLMLIVPQDRRDEETSILEKLKRGEKVETFETVRQRKDGTTLYVSVTASPVRDASGRVVGASKVARDITARKRTEKALVEGAQRQKALFHLADELHRATSLENVYDAALNAIIGALQCDRASILICDDRDVMRFVSWRGLSDSYRMAVEGHSVWRIGDSDPQPICVSDIDMAEMSDSLKRTVKAEGISALAFIPLVSDGKLIGKFVTYFNAPHPFSNEEVELSLTIARQLAFGIERKRSETALRQSQSRLAAEANALARLNDWSSRLWRIRNLKEGLDEMLVAVIELLGADRGNIHLLDPERGVLTIATQHGFDQNAIDFLRDVSVEADLACSRALRLRQPVVIKDVEADAPFVPFRALARAAQFRSVVSAPLLRANGTPMGTLSIHFSSVHRPTDQDLRRLDLYVRQAGDFLQRCKTEEALSQSEEQFRKLAETLDAEVRQRTKELEERNVALLRQSEQLRELSFRLFKVQDNERRHIARELHDSAGQILAALGMHLAHIVNQVKAQTPGLAQQAEDAQKLIEQLSRDIRTTSYLLHPPLLDETGLRAALSWYVEGLEQRSGLAIKLEIAEDFGRLPSDIELVVFRMVQECLTNIHRHSKSKSAQIRISRGTDNVSVEVEDKGKGMSPERLTEIQSGGSGVGIRGMRERIRHFQGELRIESNKFGTRVSVTIPIPADVLSQEPDSIQSLRTAV
jgi:PAS domain S-box-containing protein